MTSCRSLGRCAVALLLALATATRAAHGQSETAAPTAVPTVAPTVCELGDSTLAALSVNGTTLTPAFRCGKAVPAHLTTASVQLSRGATRALHPD